MWQFYALIAQDLIRDRQREAAAAALSRPVEGDDRVVADPGRPSAARAVVAHALRHLGTAASAVSRRAGAAAARLEGRVA